MNLLKIQNESLYKNPETTYQNPFRIDNLKLDPENNILVTKLKSYENFLRKSKLKDVRNGKKILTPYASFSQRKNYFDIANTNKLVEEYSPH